MEAQMGTLSLGQETELPLLIARAAERIRDFIASTPQKMEIVRPGEFCRRSDFCNDQSLDTVALIYRVVKEDPSPFRVEFLSRTSEDALIQSINLSDESALKRAVACGSLAVYYLEKDMPELGIAISAFARTLRQRWNVSQRDRHLDEAIYYFQKTTELEPPEETNRPLHLDDLGQALTNRYKRCRQEEDFTAAKQSFELAVGLEHSARPMFLSGLGQLLMKRTVFEHPEKALAFDDCIGFLESARAHVTSQYRGSISEIHYHLGHAYTKRFQASQDPQDWQKAERNFDEAISRLLSPSPNHATSSYGIASIYSDMFNRYGRLEDSDKAQALYKLALQSNADNANVLASSAEHLRSRAYCTGSQKSLEDSIQLIRKSLQITSSTDSQLPFRLAIQAHVLADRFELLGNIADIDQAISSLWKCHEAPSLTNSDRWMYQEMLGNALLLRYENSQDVEDLRNAEAIIHSALEFDGLPAGPKSICLRVYGRIIFRKYEEYRSSKDLENSIKKFQESIKLALSEDLESYFTFNDLGNAWMESFERSQSNSDLQAAASSYQEALEKLRNCSTKSTRSAEAMLLHGFGNVQLRQFQLWSRTSDLDFAISCYKKSADMTPDFNVRIATRTGALCWALQERFELSHKVADLEEAERRLKDVLALPLQLSSSSNSYLENRMGMIYLRFFSHTEDAKYLDPAATHFRNALAAGCTGPAYNVSASNNLAITLRYKAEVTMDDFDIETALSQFSCLLQLIKEPGLEMGSKINVAEFLLFLYDLKRDPLVGTMALRVYLMAIQASRVPPMRMMRTKMDAARLTFTIDGDSVAAFNLVKLALDHLPEAILAGLNRGDQLRNIRRCAWLPSNVVAFSIAAGNSTEDSLRFFESSRNIVRDNLLNENFDIGPLEVHHRELAQRFRHLQTRLAQTMPSIKIVDPEPNLMLRRQDNHQASLDYSEVLTQIRSLEGFETFLRLPQETSSLTEYAASGPVIIVNSNEFRSDCIIIKREGVVSIPLPDMTHEACAKNATSFAIAISELSYSPEKASSKFEEVLIWLWNAVAEPIMKELCLLEGDKGRLKKPRVWWMTTGWISMLPIHAAGIHKKALSTGEPCSVIDLTTSSYFNSLRSLAHAREKFSGFTSSSTESSNSPKALLVKMPETPDNEPLPGVSREISIVKGILEGCNVKTKILDSPNRDDVLPCLASCEVAHFACHGIVDDHDPSLSRLLLKDWKQRPLNVRALLRTKRLSCKLVFLSACESAVSKDRELREEGIHLSGGFQVAGVPHVVATLWKVEDQFSVQIAETFYGGLRADGGLEIGRSSEALRNAVMYSRSKGVDSLCWAAYIHSGP
ncbi:hypothetical protein V496_01069 [Pseudogymnoascus sp. VKM F-4515 (FW-2607)]|nr:hypothetical protein V496_01069 [Pseudogymnoascus sp. VKM F-4515 (FW-2607)]KFY95957.1 hypothetical protein V498_03035 [Pseudogymnoascus sp. VKM F-4517 (FW-2822)]